MKTIHLLRHAKSSWKDEGLADFDRPLAKRGMRAAETIAAYLAEHGIRPDQILCSPAQRTRETLGIVEKGLPATVPVRFEKGIYEAEAGVLLRRLKRLSDQLASVMLIGHNPGMERLALMLVDGGDAQARERLAEKYPTAALAMLTADIAHWRDLEPNGARLDAFVRPKDLAGD